MDDKNKQYRRELMTAAIACGDLHTAIREGLDTYGRECVLVVACAKTEPGRSFFRRLSLCRPASADLQRQVREAMTAQRAIITAMPVGPFLAVMDRRFPTLRAAVTDVMSKGGALAAVVMGADGVMTAGVGAFLDALDGLGGSCWAVQCGGQSAGTAERDRRSRRRQKHGMN